MMNKQQGVRAVGEASDGAEAINSCRQVRTAEGISLIEQINKVKKVTGK